MAIPMTRLGGRAFAHSADDDDDVEREYDRLRDLARDEARKRNQCFERSKAAYSSGDGAGAKSLSNEGKSHASRMEDYNRQASDYIFRENNGPGRVEPDCIDLHGQFVDEAERIVEDRIRAERQRGSSHLHVIVGRGNHSADHLQKIKPRVEEVCREMHLTYRTEENEGRIYIDLKGQGGGGDGGGHYQPPPQQGGYPGHQQPPHHGHPPPHHGGGGGGGGHQDEGGDLVSKLFKKLEKHCCIVM